MKRVYTGSVTAAGGRNGHIQSNDNIIDLPLALVDGLGKSDSKKGTNPEQLFAGAYAACFETSLLAVAAAQGIRIEKSSVTAEIGINKANDGFHLSAELTISLSGIDDPTRDKLVKGAHQVCPYSRAIRNNVNVSFTINYDDPQYEKKGNALLTL